jgi:hypothetical protein
MKKGYSRMKEAVGKREGQVSSLLLEGRKVTTNHELDALFFPRVAIAAANEIHDTQVIPRYMYQVKFVLYIYTPFLSEYLWE